MDSRYKDLRQDIKETNARIDALHQALFSHKEPVGEPKPGDPVALILKPLK